jgi:hypothetical protein
LFRHHMRKKKVKMDNLHKFRITHHTSAVVIVIECFDGTPGTGCITLDLLETHVCVKSLA